MDGSTSTSNNGGEITVNNGDLPSKCNTYLMFEGNSYMLPVVISKKGTKTKHVGVSTNYPIPCSR
jgi:hypothetical protein